MKKGGGKGPSLETILQAATERSSLKRTSSECTPSSRFPDSELFFYPLTLVDTKAGS